MGYPRNPFPQPETEFTINPVDISKVQSLHFMDVVFLLLLLFFLILMTILQSRAEKGLLSYIWDNNVSNRENNTLNSAKVW